MAKKKHKRPESVLVVVYTRQGEYLLMERMQPYGFWQSVTGSLEWDETPLHAATRELQEETGLSAEFRLKDLRRGESFRIVPPWKKRYAKHHLFNREHWFALQLPSRRMIRLNHHEHRQFRWLSADQALKRASSWTNRAAIRYLEQRRQ